MCWEALWFIIFLGFIISSFLFSQKWSSIKIIYVTACINICDCMLYVFHLGVGVLLWRAWQSDTECMDGLASGQGDNNLAVTSSQVQSQSTSSPSSEQNQPTNNTQTVHASSSVPMAVTNNTVVIASKIGSPSTAPQPVSVSILWNGESIMLIISKWFYVPLKIHV